MANKVLTPLQAAFLERFFLKRIEKDKKVGKKIEITYKNKPNQ